MDFTASESEPNSHYMSSGAHVGVSMASGEKLEEGAVNSHSEQARTAFQDRVDSVKAIKPLVGWHLAAVAAA